MKFIDEIYQSFPAFPVVKNLIAGRLESDCDQDDALSFLGKAWIDVGFEDWQNYRGAFYAFCAEAFLYYLPSIMCLSYKNPEQWLEPADSLLGMLDRIQEIDSWDQFSLSRLGEINLRQCRVMIDWLLLMNSNSSTYPSISFDNVFYSLVKLESFLQRP